MNTTGLNLQQVHPASGQKPAGKDPAAPATTHEAIQSARAQSPHSLEHDAPAMVQTFASPPPLSHRRASVRRSYTSLIAMAPSESLLPPSCQTDTRPLRNHSERAFNLATNAAATAAATTATTTATTAVASGMNSPVVETAPESQMAPMPVQEAKVASAPPIARATAYPERCISAKDIIGAIDDLWGLDQLPSVELFSKE
ncbi:MAG: hypothetical protein EKK48_03800 [Candidatus Melainabacteria bacterium]|nr:MAG: hypothetical protein EKK48_03800 [Candidatus Melainabacteria bacterium]